MEFDIKNSLTKSFVGGNQLSKKNIDSTIDQSMIASTAQKSLGMDLKKENEKLAKEKERKEKEKKEKNDQAHSKSKKSEEEKIVRDPLMLLKIF